MRKMPVVALVAAALLIVGAATPMMLRAQVRAPAAAAAADDMPRRTTKAFAPFLKAIITRRYNQAQQIFKLRRNVEASLEQEEPTRILSRFTKPDRFDLNLIGGRTLGQNIGILVFTIATEDGPVAFKIYYYGFNNDINISRIEVYDDWDQIEALAATVDILPSPVTMSLGTPAE